VKWNINVVCMSVVAVMSSIRKQVNTFGTMHHEFLYFNGYFTLFLSQLYSMNDNKG
jgi:hypothetical protein